jgi:hypothetical protein
MSLSEKLDIDELRKMDFFKEISFLQNGLPIGAKPLNLKEPEGYHSSKHGKIILIYAPCKDELYWLRCAFISS